MNLKKKMMLVLSMVIIPLSVFLSDIQVHAATSLVNAIIDPGLYSMPLVEGNPDNSVPFEFDLSRGYNFGDKHGISLNSNNYYLIFLTGRPVKKNMSYSHSTGSIRMNVTPYFTYGGNIYYGNSSNEGSISGTDEYRLSCIFQGNLSGSAGIGLQIKGVLNPYYEDGYYYQDSFKCDFEYKPECRLFRLAFNEDPTIQQLEMINNNLLRIWQDVDYLEEHMETVNATILSILNSTESIESKIDALNNLLSQQNSYQQQGNQLQQQGNNLQQQGNNLQQEGNDLQEEANETSKGILSKVTDFFGSFFSNLVNSVIGVFVPSTQEISSLFNRLNQFFSDTFGFLYYPFDFIIQAFDVFLNSDSSTGLTLPGFSIMGYEVWGDQTYDLASDPVAGTIFSYVRIGTGAILSMFFVGYLRAFFEKRFGGGGS